MAVPGNSAYRRITGRLRLSSRGAILETPDDALFYIVTSDDLAEFDGRLVVVEGQLSAVDRITLIWIGPAK